jgi:uncharacterized protein with GYD domain
MCMKRGAGCSGRVEAFYFAFGETDVFTIIELPDNVAAAALAATIATGMISPRTRVLLTPQEMDAATKKTVEFRPPGA